MAQMFPKLDEIVLMKKGQIDGEMMLLRFLDSALDDTYQVCFRPFINADNPDVVILREGTGAMIIQVSELNPENYKLNPKADWEHKSEETGDHKKKTIVVRSPVLLVEEYKKNLYDMHIKGLLLKSKKRTPYWGIVRCAVFFPNSSAHEATALLRDTKDSQMKDSEKKDYYKKLNYIEILGKDSLNEDTFRKFISKSRFDRVSDLFDKELYNSFKWHINPPFHHKSAGRHIEYTPEQKMVIGSREGAVQKVRGVAGSGKTIALARRAVNAHIRHKGRVLILTFNITLRNYIHYRMHEVEEDFGPQFFVVTNYHEFMKGYYMYLKSRRSATEIPPGGTLEKCDQPVPTPTSWKFHTILIDEIQDYDKIWVENIKKFLVEDGGELVVFGDEKQNVYKRALENSRPYTGIEGEWITLTKSYRMKPSIADLSLRYQSTLFADKYERDGIQVVPDPNKGLVEYHYIGHMDVKKPGDVKAITDIYHRKAAEIALRDRDLCFISAHVETLQFVEEYLKVEYGKATTTTFEDFDDYLEVWGVDVREIMKYPDTNNKIAQEVKGNFRRALSGIFKTDLDMFRRNKKIHFRMRDDTIKLCTTHSFKGWEIETLFVIIEEPGIHDNEFTTDELVYTAITRCTKNLIIINAGNKHYHEFFENGKASDRVHDLSTGELLRKLFGDDWRKNLRKGHLHDMIQQGPAPAPIPKNTHIQGS